MDAPTERQQAILDFLGEHLAATGLPPTVNELALAFGIRPNAARKHLQALAAKGLVVHAAGKARGYQLPRSGGGGHSLPLVGRVAAGSPVLSEGNVEARFNVDPALFRPQAHYLLRVEGDSMRDAGIHDGDLIAVHRSPEAMLGQIVVVRLEGEITVKRLGRDAHGLLLLPENPDYAPIPVPPSTIDFAIEGLYVGLVRRG